MERYVEIGGKRYRFDFKTVWSPLYLYESSVGRELPFDGRKLLCMHLLYYCILKAANDDFEMDAEAFLEALNDVELVRRMGVLYAEITEALSPVMKPRADAAAAADEGSKKKR